jgi:hypothetical protein
MQKFLRSVAFVALVLPPTAASATAGELKLTIGNGRVTLVAHDVTVRQILEEWARVGQTRIVNGDKIMGPPVTIELHEQPEAKALDTVLRAVAGYVVAPRMDSLGTSVYDRIMILPTSRPPAVSAAAPTFNRPAPPPPVVPMVEDDPAVNDQSEHPPGTVPPPGAQPFPGPTPNPGLQQPTTAPRPGMPPPPNVPANPYQPQTPGARPPGGMGVPSSTPGAPAPPGGSPVGPGGGPGGGRDGA